ncbi:hypothetical protein ACSV5M_21735 [Cellvibrio sp. ARAG 10.3]|uniref:hypothetical protein n=1 Tax=Cellvibrio sp. ARAG 10.3 TaxID=3451358 RepID=UPI003F44940C
MNSQNTLPCDASFKQHVRIKCYEALAAVGFTRYRKEDVDWPLDKNFHGWVGLNTGLYDEYIEVNPFIGIHSVAIEKLWTSLKVGKYPSKYNRGVATYSVHMGELVPNVPAFEFTREANIEEEAKRLAQLYLDYGLPYSKSLANYEALLPLLKERVDMLGAYPERGASCLYLMGRIEEAREFTESFLAKKKDYFEGFAIPFLQKIAH